MANYVFKTKCLFLFKLMWCSPWSLMWWRWVLWEVIGVVKAMRIEPFDGVIFLMKRWRVSRACSLSVIWRHSKRMVICNMGTGDSPLGTKSACSLMLDFPASITVRKKLYHLNNPVYVYDYGIMGWLRHYALDFILY